MCLYCNFYEEFGNKEEKARHEMWHGIMKILFPENYTTKEAKGQ